MLADWVAGGWAGGWAAGGWLEHSTDVGSDRHDTQNIRKLPAHSLRWHNMKKFSSNPPNFGWYTEKIGLSTQLVGDRRRISA